MADVLERAKSTDPDAIVQAIKTTSLKEPLMVSAGPIQFNEVGDNANTSTAMIQILDGHPTVVYRAAAAQARFVFPKPKT
jgi:hypothetical protein